MATVATLRKQAKKQGVKGYSAMNKAELLEVLADDTEITVVDAVKGDLRELGNALSKSALAASALTLAAELDDRENSATSKAMCSKALIDTLDRLRELAPPKKEQSKLDDLDARRKKRRARSAAATG